MGGAQGWMWAMAAAGMAVGWWIGRRSRSRQLQALAKVPRATEKAEVSFTPAVAAPSAVAAKVQEPEDLGRIDLTTVDGGFPLVPNDLQTQMEVLRRMEEAAEAERDDLLAERDTLSRQLAEFRQRLAIKTAESDSLSKKLSQIQGAAAALESRVVALEPLQQSLAHAQLRMAESEQQLGDGMAKIRSLQAELLGLQHRNAALQAQLGKAESDLHNAASQDQLQEALGEAMAARERLADVQQQLEDLQESKVVQQRQLMAMHGATTRARKLALQLREAKAAVLAARPWDIDAQAHAVSGEWTDSEELLSVADAALLVGAWAVQPGVHSVALADARGLLVAGQGAQAQALAAKAAALYQSVLHHNRPIGGLTLGAADVMQVRDQHGLSLYLKPWLAPGGVLLLALLAREGMETEPWAAELLHRPHRVCVWSNLLIREKKPVVAPAPLAQLAAVPSVLTELTAAVS